MAFLLKKYILALISRFEPALESGLKSSIESLQTNHPEQAKLFLSNWDKLDTAVRSQFTTKVAGKRKTHKVSRRRT